MDRENMMKTKLYAFALTSLLAGGALAQSSPPGLAVPPNTPGIASDAAQRAGEARKNLRQQRSSKGVPKSGGDEANAREINPIGTDKATMAGEARAETRDARRPGKRKTTQGGTPN